MNWRIAAWLAVSIAFEVVGDVCVKRASVAGGAGAWMLTAAAYGLMLLTSADTRGHGGFYAARCALVMPAATRAAVYSVLDGERDYQDAQQGNAKRHDGQPPMTPGEYILCMEKCLHDARETWYRPDGGQACLDYVRKVTALGVQCMELHGAPPRVR